MDALAAPHVAAITDPALLAVQIAELRATVEGLAAAVSRLEWGMYGILAAAIGQLGVRWRRAGHRG